MRLYTDYNVGTSIGRALRLVGVEVELHVDRYASGLVPDEKWIAEVTATGLVILTKDTRIRSRPNERSVFEAVGAKAFVLATRGASKLVNLRAVLNAWDEMTAIADMQAAPFMYGIDRHGKLTQYIPPPPRPTGRSDPR